MKILLCTTPIRPVPTDYPPFGSLAVIQSLRAAGYDPVFYDIDGLRPSFEDVLRRLKDERPDVLAVSAVVSTAYAYTKQLVQAVKRELPGTIVLVGGNLAASAEILHRCAGVDVCAVGEGEKVSVNLMRRIEADGGRLDRRALRAVKGVSFLDEGGNFVFTGFEEPLAAGEFLDPDFGILERDSRIDNFVCDPFSRPDFRQDPRSYQPHRRSKKMSTVLSTKGCVARCTFCHRWDKGYRQMTPDAVVRRIKYLMDRYNVGFLSFGDENFGSDRRSLEELVRLIKPLDVLYQVAGVRVRSVDPDLLARLKDSGMVSLHYGMETGSPGILQVMEKNASLEHNLRAARWTREAGLYTVYQLVLAMPGESRRTVEETLDFVKQVTAPLPEPPHKYLSTNYIQALPGTPVYEYARRKGYLGATLADEEKYLLMVSDIDAADDSKFINFTEEDYFTVQTWRFKILFEAEAHWYRVRGWAAAAYRLPSGAESKSRDYYTEGGYFNLKRMFHHRLFYRFGWPVRHAYYYAYALAKDVRRLPPALFWRSAWDFLKRRFRKRSALDDLRSLRRIMKEIAAPPATPSEEAMQPLRLGR